MIMYSNDLINIGTATVVNGVLGKVRSGKQTYIHIPTVGTIMYVHRTYIRATATLLSKITWPASH
jgi:hypothetical protein